MKKFLLLLSLCLASSYKASAFYLPSDKDGAIAQHLQSVGVNVYYSTGTFAPFLVTGGTTTFLTTLDGAMGARGSTIAVYGILTSTPQGINAVAAATSPGFVHLRATDTANTATELLVPPINIGTFVSSTTIAGESIGDPANVLIVFDPPVIAMDNLSVSASSNPVGVNSSAVFSFAVFYRYLSTGEVEDVWIPTDGRQGEKTHDHGFYGVKPSSTSTSGATAENSAAGLGTEAWDFTSGRKVINANSTDTANINSINSQLFFYGYSASSGSVTNFFTCASTGSTLGTLANNLLPSIYPRTLGAANYTRGFVDPDNFIQFNFPWPLKAPNGLACQMSSAADRMRFYTRNRRALR